MRPDRGNPAAFRKFIWVFVVGLPISSLSWGSSHKEGDSSNILFFDAFCCGHLDKWTHSHGRFPLEIFNQSGVLNWQNLHEHLASGGVTTGPLPLEDYSVRFEMVRWPVTRVGTCIVVRAATGENCLSGYRLRIEGNEAWLEKHTGGRSWRSAEMREGPVDVEPERFHTVIIEVHGNNEARVRAKIWSQATTEPENFQMELLDDSPSAIRTGPLGAGVWYAVAGEWSEPYLSADIFSVKPLTASW